MKSGNGKEMKSAGGLSEIQKIDVFTLPDDNRSEEERCHDKMRRQLEAMRKKSLHMGSMG